MKDILTSILNADYLVVATIVITLALITYFLIRRTFNALYKKKMIPVNLRSLVLSLSKGLIILTTILLLVQKAGVEISVVWTAISAFMVLFAVGFVAAWSVLSNMLCSFLLLSLAPIKLGDDMKLMEMNGDGVRGKVKKINLFFSTLEYRDSESGEMLTYRIPNNLFFQKIIKIYDEA